MNTGPPEPTMDERYSDALILAKNWNNNGISRETIKFRLSSRGLDQANVDSIVQQLPDLSLTSTTINGKAASESWSSRVFAIVVLLIGGSVLIVFANQLGLAGNDRIWFFALVIMAVGAVLKKIGVF